MTMADQQLQKSVMRPWSKPQTHMANHELKDAVFALFSENRKDLPEELCKRSTSYSYFLCVFDPSRNKASYLISV